MIAHGKCKWRLTPVVPLPAESDGVYYTYRGETPLAARYRGSEVSARRCSQRQNVRATNQLGRLDAVPATITDSCRTASVNGTGEEPVWLPRDACTEQTGRESPGKFSYL